MTGNCHVRCGVGENSEIISKSYLSLLLVFRFIEQEVINAREANKSGKNLRTLIISEGAFVHRRKISDSLGLFLLNE